MVQVDGSAPSSRRGKCMRLPWYISAPLCMLLPAWMLLAYMSVLEALAAQHSDQSIKQAAQPCMFALMQL